MSNGNLFDLEEWWREHWQGMPEYLHEDKKPKRSIVVHFKSEESVRAFAKATQLTITADTKTIQFPQQKRSALEVAYVDESTAIPDLHH